MLQTYRRLLVGTCAAAGAVAFGPFAAAAIVAGGNGTQNITSAGTVSQFTNVGQLNGSSGVYLGNGVVLTAAHVGAGTIFLQGVPYNAVSGSDVRLVDP